MSRVQLRDIILAVASHDYPDPDFIVGYVERLPPETGVMTGNGEGADQLITATCQRLRFPVRNFHTSSTDNIVRMVSHVVIFYKNGSDHERLKEIRNFALEFGKALIVFRADEAGKTRRIAS